MIPQRRAAGASERRRRRSKCHKTGDYCSKKQGGGHECIVRLHRLYLILRVLLADQTPTPTRFLQNCEEVGLFKEIEEEFLQEQEEEKNKEVHLPKETDSWVIEIQEEDAIYALFRVKWLKGKDKSSRHQSGGAEIWATARRHTAGNRNHSCNLRLN